MDGAAEAGWYELELTKSFSPWSVCFCFTPDLLWQEFTAASHVAVQQVVPHKNGKTEL